MRKARYKLLGFYELNGKNVSIDELGRELNQSLSKSRFDLFKSNDVCNQIFMLDLNNSGFRNHFSFYYHTEKEKKNILTQYLKENIDNLKSFMLKNYRLDNNFKLEYVKEYDVDCSCLSLEMLKNDLTEKDFKEVLKDIDSFPMTTVPEKLKGIDVYFGGYQ